MRSTLRHTLAGAAFTLMATACGPFHRGGQADAVVVFHNQSIDQADVYAIGAGGQPVRVGTVFGNRTETLHIPSDVIAAANRVNIVVRVFPSSKIVASGPFSLGPGDSMDVTRPSQENLIAVLPSRQ